MFEISKFQINILLMENSQNVKSTGEKLPKEIIEITARNVEKFAGVHMTDKTIRRYTMKFKETGNGLIETKDGW